MAYSGLAETQEEGTRPGLPVRRLSLVGAPVLSLRSDELALTSIHRRVLFFPYGNHVEHASFYLEHAWENEPPANWYACVQFALVLSNVNDPSIYISHGAYSQTGSRGYFR